jgi:hypothetical protein
MSCWCCLVECFSNCTSTSPPDRDLEKNQRSLYVRSICTSRPTCGACWRTKCKVTILPLQTTCQKRSGSNTFNLSNKSWTWSESHVRRVACLQAGLNHFCTPNTNCNRVNYIMWTPIHTTLEKMAKAVLSAIVRIDLRSGKSYCKVRTLYHNHQMRLMWVVALVFYLFVYTARKT